MKGFIAFPKSFRSCIPTSFEIYSLVLDDFTPKITVPACMGKFLEEVGVDSVFVANEMFGPNIATSVTNGSHYVRAKHGMMLLSDSLLRRKRLFCFPEFISANHQMPATFQNR